MTWKTVSRITMVLLMASVITLTSEIPHVEAPYPTAYIRTDGRIEGTTYIQTADNVTYVLVADMDSCIIIERDNVTLDGNGYKLRGPQLPYFIGVDLIRRTNVTVKNMQISGFYGGIYLDSSSNFNSICGNNLTNIAYWCIFLATSSNYNNICQNDLVSVNGGIHIGSFVKYTRIFENNIAASNGIGIWLTGNSLYSSVIGNQISDSEIGVLSSYQYSSNKNIIAENNITHNGVGIQHIAFSSDVVIHNNFMNNGQQVSSDSRSSNTWDDGYPSGGNYWSDYNGTDLYGGPYQNETESDGMGDILYVIDANNTDNYPLISPWSLPDIAVLNISVSRTAIGFGQNETVCVALDNLHKRISTFNLTVYADSITIYSGQITLALDNGTFYFNWNTTRFDRGNHTIDLEAYAEPVSGEVNTANNMYVGTLKLHVGIPQDVNHDGVVNMKDVLDFLSSHTFNAFSEGRRYDPSMDVDGSGRIDIRDLLAVVLNFNKHE